MTVKTKKIVLDIMNDICTDIKFTAESQEDYNDEFIPTLDFQLKLHNVHDMTNAHAGLLTYKFYKKPIASKFAILFNSALSINTKSNTICQEFLRRLSNTSQIESQSVKDQILEDYVMELKLSGYPVI